MSYVHHNVIVLQTITPRESHVKMEHVLNAYNCEFPPTNTALVVLVPFQGSDAFQAKAFQLTRRHYGRHNTKPNIFFK